MDNYKSVFLPLIGSVFGSYIWYSFSSSNSIKLCEVDEKDNIINFDSANNCHKNIIGASLVSGVITMATVNYLNKN